jgi:hypothetical protein
MAQKLTPEILIAAISGFEAQKNQIDSRIAEIRQMLDGGGHSEPVASTATEKPRKKFSAASRRKMAAAQRARYAKLREDSEPTQAVTAKPKKRKMSAAGKAAIAAGVKRRWAAVRAAKKAAA